MPQVRRRIRRDWPSLLISQEKHKDCEKARLGPQTPPLPALLLPQSGPMLWGSNSNTVGTNNNNGSYGSNVRGPRGVLAESEPIGTPEASGMPELVSAFRSTSLNAPEQERGKGARECRRSASLPLTGQTGAYMYMRCSSLSVLVLFHNAPAPLCCLGRVVVVITALL